MTTFAAAIIFILGSAIGSFLSVVIYRTNKDKKGIIFSRSICPACKKKIKWRHLIPIFSWLFLRGKCAYCGKKISPHYLSLEIITALSFLIIFFKWNFIESFSNITTPELLNYDINTLLAQSFVFYAIIFSFLIVIFFYDLLHKEIPDRFSLPAIAIAIAGNLLLGTQDWLNMLIGGAAIGLFFALQFLISRGTWIGGGDIRLGALIGVLLGWELGLLALVMAYLIGAFLSIFLLISKKVKRKSQIPFGPFLIMGVYIAFFYGKEILDWYLNVVLI